MRGTHLGLVAHLELQAAELHTASAAWGTCHFDTNIIIVSRTMR